MRMVNPRRNSENPFNIQNYSSLSSLTNFLKRPHAFPFLLSIFLLLTWVSLRFQHSSRFSRELQHQTQIQDKAKHDDRDHDDAKANLIRFKSDIPSLILKDKRGWLLNPVSLALDSGIKGGAVSCVSLHVGEIRPGAVRGNHRHYTSNETFIFWGAQTKFRLENNQVDVKGYAEVIVAADEVAVATSPHGTAHALVNVDSSRSTFLIGCQDGVINYNSSTSDFNVWIDL